MATIAPGIVDRENGDYVNRLTVVYHSVEHPSQPPQATVVLIVDAGLALNRDQLRREIEQLHYSRDDQGRPEHQPFELDDHYHHVSWGADAASLEFIVKAAARAAGGAGGGIVGGAAWDGLKAIGQRIRSAKGPAWPQAQQIDDQLAIRHAKQIAAASFTDVETSGFTVLAVSLSGETATVVMRYNDGSTFTV